MKKIVSTAIAAALWGAATSLTPDWAGHERYAEANASLAEAPAVVFMGNSITDGWDDAHPEFFTDNNFACRGISGQVTAQMLCRFKADVIDLKPRAVVILGGVNDICGNNGATAMRYILDNMASMIDLARSAGIVPLVATPTPTDYAFWRPELKGLGKAVVEYRDALARLCAEKGVDYIDYYSALDDGRGEIDSRYSDDRLHPNRAGYDVMEPIVLAALAKAGITR